MKPHGIVFDCDGTLYHGAEPIDHAVGFVNRLVDELGIKVMYYTNRAYRTPEEVATVLSGMGFPATPAQILTGGTVTANELQGRTAFCIGSPPLKTALEERGVSLTASEADFVVVGYTEDIKGVDLTTAIQLICHHNAEFVATNQDAYIFENGKRVHENGPLLAAVREAVGREPIIYGKPHQAGIRMARRTMGLEQNQMMLVGDNLETDIQCGICAGIDTVLLLTGVTSRRQVEAAHPEARPTWVAEHLGDPVWEEILTAAKKTGIRLAR